MATARKCDRCGKYYDENKKYRYDLTMGAVIGLRLCGCAVFPAWEINRRYALMHQRSGNTDSLCSRKANPSDRPHS